MADRVSRCNKSLRPHAKAHKCTAIAKRQIAAGAIGVCVATITEAELMASAGIRGILLTSPVADPLKIRRVVESHAMAAVDHVQQARWYAEAAEEQHLVADLLVDLDVGDHRTGAASVQQAVEIAQFIDGSEHLRLRGIQAYSVLGSHAGGFERRRAVSNAAFEAAREARDQFLEQGLPCEIVTGGSTGSWDIDTALDVPTELQAGSYVLMDLAYRREGLDFEHAMTVLATVVSANHEQFVTLDAGFKAFSTDRGYGPEAVAVEGSTYRWGGDEFGYLDITEARPRLGDKIELIPPHCDPTANLYDRIYACRGNEVEAVWGVKQTLA